MNYYFKFNTNGELEQITAESIVDSFAYIVPVQYIFTHIIDGMEVKDILLNELFETPEFVQFKNSCVSTLKIKETTNIISETANVVNLEIGDGLSLVGIEDANLTSEQIILKNKALNFTNKMIARYNINNQVGDVYDQIADVEKKLNMFSGMIIRMYLKVFHDIDVPADIKANYDTFALMFKQLVELGQYKDTADIHNAEELVTKTIEKDILKATIVEADYLIKKLPIA